MKRRSFLKKFGGATALVSSGVIPMNAMANLGLEKITILHTNDVHSRVEPFPSDAGKYAGKGGAARRASLVAEIRKQEKNVLLLDAGDIFQGTPFFNYFGGELEFKLMSKMNYDAATLGNHDFDVGTEGFVKQLPHANFAFLNANYTFKNTPLEGKIEPYKVFQKGKLRIGVFGIGIELDGLVPAKLCEGIQYLDPIKNANKTAAILKNDEVCDLVICLSHLGYKYDSNKMSDQILAVETKNIDLILGGHTHTFLEKPEIKINTEGKKVMINQVGWAGVVLGRLDFLIKPNRKKHIVTSSNILVY